MNQKKKLLKRFSKYIYPYIKEEIILFILMICSSAGSLVTPYMLKVIIDDVFPSGNYHDLIMLLVLLVGIYIVQIICSLVSDVMSTTVSKKISSDIREEAFANILNKNISFFKDSKVGELVFTLMNDVDNIQQTTSSLLIRSVKNIIVLIGVLIMLFILDYTLALMSLLFIPAIVFVIRAFTPYVKKNFTIIQKMEGSLNNYLVERIKNIRVIKSYKTVDLEEQNLKALHSDLVSKHSKGTFISSLNGSVSSLLMSLAPILVLSYGGYQVFQNAMSVGVLIAFIQYLNRLFTPTLEIVNSYNQFSKSLVSMNRVSEYFNVEKTTELQEDKDPRNEIEQIIFKNISLFHGNNRILNEINLTFDQGKTYILSGGSGSGKSSIINLLCGFTELTNGELKINNQDIKENKYWKNEFCLIEKENQLFHDTLERNIKYGTLKSQFEIEDVLKYARLEEVVKKLENGSDTLISYSGGTLSDGQKQRVSIARAINRSPSVFIFDESTASLDAKLETEIINNIRNLFPKSIIIIVSHRSETFELADRIYTLDKGNIEDNMLSQAI
ncbi:ATP-binding cassette, subfamily B [Chryseobacterium arachidis]|uniref:ATP-binding cassette, subfamily B n=1 Tax=Chryseobacterium arachidis TaxID=1416778 RepID=A0A1M5MM67_9FLAO|nr:ABC transporter ATP-binding protein [Chryseobacterium arachidis]SHG78398.1 ATP-binding cassette, subfamily B [Chryseobacterium arachidis]